MVFEKFFIVLKDVASAIAKSIANIFYCIFIAILAVVFCALMVGNIVVQSLIGIIAFVLLVFCACLSIVVYAPIKFVLYLSEKLIPSKNEL